MSNARRDPRKDDVLSQPSPPTAILTQLRSWRLRGPAAWMAPNDALPTKPLRCRDCKAHKMLPLMSRVRRGGVSRVFGDESIKSATLRKKSETHPARAPTGAVEGAGLVGSNG